MSKLTLTGMRFGRLLAVKDVGANKYRKRLWEFLCDCGNTLTAVGASAVSGNVTSCGCFRKEVAIKRLTKHGMSSSPEYKSWANMFRRCYYKGHKDYENYSSRGIIVHEDFSDFTIFLNEIGRKPEDGQRWSIGRIDNNLSYQPGNVQWETDVQQARNHSKQSNNKSGIVGVFRNSNNRWVGCYNTIDGKHIQKSYSTLLYGEDGAKQLATEFREENMKLLQEQGAEYAESHGSEKELVNG